MIYIIEGEEELFIRNKIDEIINKEDSEIIKFDGNSKDFDINEVFDACLSNSLFSSKTIVLVKDAPFLMKKNDESELKIIENYINNPLYETDLVLYTYENKHNSKLKAYKTISKNAEVLVYNNYDYKNFPSYVRQQINLNKLDINNDAIVLLESICKRNATLLQKNIEILNNYPDKITSEVVSALCSGIDNLDSFEIINALTSKNISLTISLERKMLKQNDSIMTVIGLLSNQLRFLYDISFLQTSGFNRNQIIEKTNCNEYRLKMAQNTLRKLDCRQIISLLNSLSKLDIDCKNDNSISDQSRFELFILNMLERNEYASN